MPQPWKHPKLGTYYFRKVVPVHLRAAVGKTELRIPLGTKEVSEAKLRSPAAAAKADALLARAPGGPAKAADVTDAEIDRLAAIWFAEVLEEDEEARREGLDERSYAKLTDAFDIADIGGRFALARGDASTMAFETDDLLERN